MGDLTLIQSLKSPLKLSCNKFAIKFSFICHKFYQKQKSIEDWPGADYLIGVLLIYPGLNGLVFGFQGDAYFFISFLNLRLV